MTTEISLDDFLFSYENGLLPGGLVAKDGNLTLYSGPGDGIEDWLADPVAEHEAVLTPYSAAFNQRVPRLLEGAVGIQDLYEVGESERLLGPARGKTFLPNYFRQVHRRAAETGAAVRHVGPNHYAFAKRLLEQRVHERSIDAMILLGEMQLENTREALSAYAGKDALVYVHGQSLRSAQEPTTR